MSEQTNFINIVDHYCPLGGGRHRGQDTTLWEFHTARKRT